MTKSHKHTNRLIDSTSPYLLQHAHNPVDWYTWGDEAFEKAAEEDKPIFLSIGYSTCHWCHVMAHESFEDEAVAKLLNENFISIKVDREERPDIDQFYMSAATTLIGRGGWPLTIVMGPDKRPFFAGTYFPKNSTARQMGMLDLLPRLVDAWNNQRPEIHAAMDQIVNAVKERSSSKAGQALNGDNLTAAASDFMNSYDRADGGFGSAPKFPSPHNLVFLMREGYRKQEKTYIDAALHTLKEMRLGGLFDHIGYGFHRYSTDAQWHVPHFEKMLYDQATLMQAYTEAWELSGDQFYLQTVAEIFSYLTDKLITPEGAYYAAEDADSEGEEGKFYVWSWDELTEVIGTDELKTWDQSFDLKPEGNFNDEVSHQASGSNIFHLRSEEDYWASTGNPDWEQVREKLYNARETRIAPGLDNKILGDWNGLVLTALSRAAQATGDERYAQAAGNLADYIMDKLVTEDGDLLHMPDQKGQKILGFLDDYSFIVEGLRHYYELSFDPKYLAEALRLQKIQIKRFWDDAQGGFYLSAGNDDLLIRQKDVYDGAIRSGNSVAATNLYYLGRVSENPLWEEYSTKIGMVFSEQVQRAPRGFSALLQSVQAQITGSKEVVIAGSPDDLNAAITTIRKYYDPFKLVLFRPNQGFEQIENISGFLAYQKAIEGNLTVYICEDYACQQPLTDITNLELALKANTWEIIDE